MPQSYGLMKHEPRESGNNNLLIKFPYNTLILRILKTIPPIVRSNIFHFSVLEERKNEAKIV